MKHAFSSLRITLIAGIILCAITILAMSVFYLADISGKRLQRQQDNFAKALREYDLYASGSPDIERDYKKLNDGLNRLEKMTISMESWYSVLKRRRALLQKYPESSVHYNKSLDNASELYPAAPLIAALNTERFIKNKAITPYDEEKIRSWLPAFINEDYNALLLSLHVLLGDFRNPGRALEHLPSYLITDGNESVSINLILLKMLRGDVMSAASDVQTMLYTLAPSDDGLRFIAEFFYDFGELEKSAEIFTRINDERALSRASDALYLAGYEGSAKNLWKILAQRRESAEDAERIKEKSLYNLGVTSADPLEAIDYFNMLLNLDTDNVSDFRQFGLIRYSRLLDLPQAIEALEKTRGLSPIGYPFIDLEICKRQSVRWELKRQLAEAWLLIDRHPEDEDLYRWASWLFLFQRNYSEIQILLSRIEKQKFAFSGKNNWIRINRAIQLMFKGELEAADNILSEISGEQADWVVFANLGRIMEANRNHALAVEQYELAINKNPAPKAAARVQIRKAKCLTAIQHTREARLALENALELDPGNLTARMELDRIQLAISNEP